MHRGIKIESKKPGEIHLHCAYMILSFTGYLLLVRSSLLSSVDNRLIVEKLVGTWMAFALANLFYLALVYRYLKPKRNVAVALVITTGTALRICYTLFTGVGTRTYDVYREGWGHLDYIRYVADHLALPMVNDGQTYHPPVHHIISATVLLVARKLTENGFYQLKLVQLVMAAFSSIGVFLVYKILKEVGASKVAVLAGTAFFAFHPTNIYLASRINNDNLLLFFYTLAFYFLIRWLNRRDMKNMLLLALAASLAFLTKKSALILFFVCGAVFLTVLIRERADFARYVRQYMVFGCLAIPLSLSFTLRNYILFNQSFDYVPSLGKGFTPTFSNLLQLPLENFLASPFNHGGLKGGEYFLEFLFKSSVFGEWDYPGLERLGTFLLAAAAAISLYIAVSFFWIGREEGRRFGIVFLLNLAIPMIMAVKFRIDFPIACSQDFRYIAPVLLTLAYLLGKGAHRLSGSGSRIVRYMSVGLISAFCLLSAWFVLSLRNYA